MRYRLVVVFVASLILLCLPTALFAQSKHDPITASAVWQAPSDFLAKAHAACDKATPSTRLGDCVIAQMSKAGAPAAAVAFTRELYQEAGSVGILSGLDKIGPVDIAWVKYPLDSSNGLLLVNGQPRIINVEDLKQLDLQALGNSPQFQDLQNQFPKVGVWPGDRDGKTWPNAQPRPNGGWQFIIGYPLRNGCLTCASAGSALFLWNFDKDGKFLGTSLLGMTPAPLPPIVNPQSSQS